MFRNQEKIRIPFRSACGRLLTNLYLRREPQNSHWLEENLLCNPLKQENIITKKSC